MRKFAPKFSGVAEGLGYNDVALKDLFNSALDEHFNWCTDEEAGPPEVWGIWGVPGSFPLQS